MNSSLQNQKHLVFYFQVHQPTRLRKLPFFEIGSGPDYFDDDLNEQIVNRIAQECYLPTNAMLLKLIQANPKVRISFSISGVALDQFEAYTPEVLDSFRALAATGSVEFLAETNYHSLASVMPGDEFEIQVNDHMKRIENLLGVRPKVFRNTELIYNDDIGRKAAHLGFRGILCEGIEKVLGDRNPYQLYKHPDEENLRLILRSNRLSDDIAFRFQHVHTTLSVREYLSWLKNVPGNDSMVVLGMDYETFGEHHKADTGIRKFLSDLLTNIVSDDVLTLSMPSDVLQSLVPKEVFSTTRMVSWADREKDTSAWLGNPMQTDAFDRLMNLEKAVKRLHRADLLSTWRNLLTSDHFYYMSTKNEEDGSVHSYFSHYASPYEAFVNYMNVLSDFSLVVQAEWVKRKASDTSIQIPLEDVLADYDALIEK
jgi:alpha-amylase